MLLYNVIFMMLTYRGSQALIQCADDCVIIQNCKEVSEHLNSTDKEVIDIIKSVLCGINPEKDEYRLCCSKFSSELHSSLSTRFVDSTFDKLPQKCGDINGDRVVGGETAKLGEFPWMALIGYGTRDGKQYNCAGTLINSLYILTAAHCIKPHMKNVRLGEYNTETIHDCPEVDNSVNLQCQRHEDYEIEEHIKHENFCRTNGVNYNDIALIRLNSTVNYRKNISPICLPVTSSLKSYEIRDKYGVVAGWGQYEHGHRSAKLRKATLKIANRTRCDYLQNSGNYVQHEITNRFCAGTHNQDSCNGDSGGPLMMEQSYNGVERMVQYGIVSYGDKYCGTNKFGVYTEVAKYMDWILDKIRP